MGQMTVGVMLGVAKPKLPAGKFWFDGVRDRGYKLGLLSAYPAGSSAEPQCDEQSRVVGILLAVGGSGERGCVDLLEGDEPVALSDFAKTVPYKAAVTKARKAFDRFARWCRTRHGVKLGRPKLWLVAAEVG